MKYYYYYFFFEVYFLQKNVIFLMILYFLCNKQAERDPREEILKAFRLFDDDNTGKISLKNLKRVARELGETMTDEEL